MDNRILTTAQAEAVYSAMCRLSNVGGAISACLPQRSSVCGLLPDECSDMWIEVFQCEETGGIRVSVCESVVESFESQSEFAEAYGLQQG